MNYEGKSTKMRQTQVQYLRKNKRNRIENNRRSFGRDEKRHKPLVLSPEYPEKKCSKQLLMANGKRVWEGMEQETFVYSYIFNST